MRRVAVACLLLASVAAGYLIANPSASPATS